MTDRLQQLVDLTRTLGQPHLNYVIIGEGNTSCRIDDTSFSVKASGQQMVNIEADGFVAVRFEPMLKMLDNPPQTQTEQSAITNDARVNNTTRLVPSIEASFHAMLLHECEVQWVGHTHPVAANRLLCSNHAENFAQRRIFPDEAVLCGPESVFVSYADPGLPLAIEMRTAVREYMDKHDEAPKVVLLKNHGMVVLGNTATEVLNITAMCVKAAEILWGAYAAGEPVFMDEADVLHIYKRPDEIYRRKQFE
jgi:rhamnose utilization protein RhaD (predicted bifunctional aldolase and dehydrogenase)